jgi:hypothetical protein
MLRWGRKTVTPLSVLSSAPFLLLLAAAKITVLRCLGQHCGNLMLAAWGQQCSNLMLHCCSKDYRAALPGAAMR